MTEAGERTSLAPKTQNTDAFSTQLFWRGAGGAASNAIISLVTAAGLVCTATVLLTIGRKHGGTDGLDQLRGVARMGVMNSEKIGILIGAQTELTTSAPPYPEAPGQDKEALLDGIRDGGGDVTYAPRDDDQDEASFARTEEVSDVLSSAGEALGATSTYATPFPPFNGDPRVYTYRVVNTYPHDPAAFTQGLVYRAPDTLFESTGGAGGAPSSVREVSLVTGTVRRRRELGREHFAEGLTMHGGRLAQLTWRSNRGFYYDPETLEQVGEFRTPLEDGWGLANDTAGGGMVVTDASHNLHFVGGAGLGPSGGAMTLARSTPVTDHGKALRFTNELEAVRGELWANVLERDCVARIDPATGVVVGWILLTGLRARQEPGRGGSGGAMSSGGGRGGSDRARRERDDSRDDVLNGIAYDEERDRVFMTGKRWSSLFEVRLREVDQTASLDLARRTCWPAESLPAYGYP
jgi:glutamine cyclotransferase